MLLPAHPYSPSKLPQVGARNSTTLVHKKPSHRPQNTRMFMVRRTQRHNCHNNFTVESSLRDRVAPSSTLAEHPYA